MAALLSRRGLLPVYIAAGLWYIVCIRFIPEPWCAFFKVIPLALLIAAIIRTQRESGSERAAWILPVVALCLSVAGDVFGDLKIGSFSDTAFLLQIFFFMGAHFVYIASFMRFAGRPRPEGLSKGDTAGRLACMALVVAFLLLYSNIIIPKVDSPAFRYAVGAYMVVISIMCLSAIMQSREGVWPMIIGALVFMASDSIIAWTSFVPDHGIPEAVDAFAVMGTYYAAQLLINIGLVRKS